MFYKRYHLGGYCPGGYWNGGILSGGVLSWGDIVRGDIVWGDIVLIPVVMLHARQVEIVAIVMPLILGKSLLILCGYFTNIFEICKH